MLSKAMGLLLAATAAAAELPMGHGDFVPTAERPVGYRGDGSGIYPGATPPLRFSEKGGTNLLWVTKIPVVEKPGGWSHSPPLVVGSPSTGLGAGRVFIAAEPDSTLCLDADTGRILWRDALGLLETPTGGWAMHSGNGYSWACSDGQAVYRLFSGGRKDRKREGALLVSYTLDGKRRWLRELQGFDNLGSPGLFGDKLILRNAAFETATGRTVWGPIEYPTESVDGNPWGHGTDNCVVPIRLKGRLIALNPGGWCLGPHTGDVLCKALVARDSDGRKWNRLGFAIGGQWSVFNTPVARADSDGSVTVVFSGSDSRAFVLDEKKEPLMALPASADPAKPPWSEKKLGGGIRVLACRLSLDDEGRIRSEPLWPESAPLVVRESGQLHPHVAICGDRVMLLHVKGQMAVLDLETGGRIGKDFQPVYPCEYKTAHLKYDLKTPSVVAAREEYDLSEELAFGIGGRGIDYSLARMGRTVYARTAVDSRNCLWMAPRLGEIFVLDLGETGNGFRVLAHNRVNQPICWCSHAAPVPHGNRLYYRTWGHLYCFEEKRGG